MLLRYILKYVVYRLFRTLTKYILIMLIFKLKFDALRTIFCLLREQGRLIILKILHLHFMVKLQIF